MAYKVILGELAKQDIRDNYQFILEKERSKRLAKHWYSAVMDSIKSLRDFPESHPVIPEAAILERELRETFIFSHRIIYSISKKPNTIFIHRVYHGHRIPLRAKDIQD